MAKTTEEKIDEIHEAVVTMRAQMEADKSICASRHQSIDDRIHGLHRVVKGNGQPGLEGKLELLGRRFDRFEAKALAWVGVAMTVGTMLGPVVPDWIKGK